MNEPSHLAKLERAHNIGVALGQVSNSLVTIDLDEDNYVAANIWIRCRDGYPPSQKLENSPGIEIG
jgi:hypothetical protein